MKPDHQIAEGLPFQLLTSVDHHRAAADYHEEAAEYHRLAAAYYTYGDYQQANENARLAAKLEKEAEKHSKMAVE